MSPFETIRARSLVPALVVAAATMLAALLAVVVPTPAVAAECPSPTFGISPDSGAPGSGFRISGNNWYRTCPDPGQGDFERDTGIRIVFVQGGAETLIGTAHAGSDGTIAGEVFVPRNASSGAATVRAEGTNGRPAAGFTVTGAPATTSTTRPSTTTTTSRSGTTSTTVARSTTSTTVARSTTTTAAAVTTTDAPPTTTGGPTTTAAEREFGAGGLTSADDDDDDSRTPLLLVAVALLLIAIVAHLYYLGARVDAAEAAAVAAAPAVAPVVVPPTSTEAAGADAGLGVAGAGAAAAAGAASAWRRDDDLSDLGDIDDEDLGDLHDLGDRDVPGGADGPAPADVGLDTGELIEAELAAETAAIADGEAAVLTADDDGWVEESDWDDADEELAAADDLDDDDLDDDDLDDELDDELDDGYDEVADEEDDTTEGDAADAGTVDEEPPAGGLRPTQRARPTWLDDDED